MIIRVILVNLLFALGLVMLTCGVHAVVGRGVSEQRQYEYARAGVSFSMALTRSHMIFSGVVIFVRLMVFFIISIDSAIKEMPLLDWQFYFGTMLMLYVYCALCLRAKDDFRGKQTFRIELKMTYLIQLVFGAVIIAMICFARTGRWSRMELDVAANVIYAVVGYVVLAVVASVAIWIILGGLDGLIERLKKKAKEWIQSMKLRPAISMEKNNGID